MASMNEPTRNTRRAAGLGHALLLGLVLLASGSHPQTVILRKGEPRVQSLLEVRHISVSIQRAPQDVYRFASNVENLPQWATGLGRTIRNVDGDWIAESPMGPVKVRFVERNDLGVLDHSVILESGETIGNPLRVVPNGTGSEVIFSLFRRPGASDQQFVEDATWVAKDLGILKRLLER